MSLIMVLIAYFYIKSTIFLLEKGADMWKNKHKKGEFSVIKRMHFDWVLS